MPSPSPEVRGLAARYRPALPDRPPRGVAGELLGRGTGSSLEFQDRRSYVVGDDVRHLDWRAFARTDQLMVRLYREEILPRLELVVDGSRSMAVDEEKAARTVDLAALVAGCAREVGMQVRILVLGDRPRELGFDELEAGGFELEGRTPLEAALREAAGLLRPGVVRVLLSDFLSPHDPGRLVRPLAARAGSLALVQVLATTDADPPAGSALRLTDAENDETLDLVLDERAVGRYRERLGRLTGALQGESRRCGGTFARVVAGDALESACRDELVPAGILEPR